MISRRELSITLSTLCCYLAPLLGDAEHRILEVLALLLGRVLEAVLILFHELALVAAELLGNAWRQR